MDSATQPLPTPAPLNANPPYSRDLMIDRFLHRDATFDGRFITGVRTTGIYCLPSCGARKPKPENVDFFTLPEQAEHAGLRPCKRCRPDLFYRDCDPDRELAEALVQRLRHEPDAFRSVAEMIDAAGVGSTKLTTLCRRFYHAAPLELILRARLDAARDALLRSEEPITDIAFAVGFETLSSFNENFRRATGMSPQQYRRLVEASSFTFDLPSWFDLGRSLTYLGRDSSSLDQQVDGPDVRFAMRLGEGVAVVRLRLQAERAKVELNTIKITSQTSKLRAAAAVHERVSRLLGLTTDPRAFERRAEKQDLVQRLIDGQQGLSIPQTHDLDDAIVWVIVGQQVSLQSAFATRRRLIERYGEPVGDGLYLRPHLTDFADADDTDLRACGLSVRKAEYLGGVARRVAADELDLEALLHAPAPVAERALTTVRGLGPWSVNYLLMRGLGFADCVPVGDVALAASLADFYHLDKRPDAAQTKELMEPFAPHRSLATFHFWNRLGNIQ